MSAGVDVALDLARFRQMSVGMRAYAEELAARLPRIAPDLTFAARPRATALSFEEQVALPVALRRLRPRLVHFLSVYAPIFAPRPYVITIHDLIHLRFPAYFKRSVGPYYATVVRAVCAGAARVITDDERTVDDLERFLGVPSSKVSVIPLGVDPAFLAPVAARAPAVPYFAYVGNHRPHKDLPTLFAAWEGLDPGLEIDLLVTGNDDLEPAAARPKRSRGQVRFLGDVPPERLPDIYRNALALVHPALCEGFGLPMLEAASVGTAVIACSDAVPAVLRPYVDVFPPRDVLTLGGLMSRVATEPRVRDDARLFAQTLTWDRCAERTAEVYRTVLRERTLG